MSESFHDVFCFNDLSAIKHPNKGTELQLKSVLKISFCFFKTFKYFPILETVLIFLLVFLLSSDECISNFRSESIVIPKKRTVLLSQIVSVPI